MTNEIENFDKGSIERIFGSKFSNATNIKLLWKGEDSFNCIFETVKGAERFICLQFYIFRNDETGNELARILKQKSLEGVKVFLLYDHFGSFGTPRSFWNDMKKVGINVRASRPFKFTRPFHYVHRDHRKLIIVDSLRAFTGGLNIANEYSGFHLKKKGLGWRDTGIMIEGPVVSEMFESFKKTWYVWGGDPIKIDDLRVYKTVSDNGIFALPIFVSSAKGRRRMRRLIYYSINHSQKSICLTTAYFVPSLRMLETLEEAVKRGVRVRILVPGISDVPIASYAGRAFFTRLLKAGVEIYMYAGEILHAKSYIFDESWSIIGSTNLDFQSFRYNDEGNVGILDVGFASKMLEIFEEDIRHSTRIYLEQWHKRPLREKIMENLFALFRRRL